MHSKIITLLALLTIAKSHDVSVGSNTEGRKIFDEKREAAPAIWRQVQNVTVNATDNEVISRIVVTDLRPEKDGDVNVIDGGEGQKSVTLELKSPTVLRGYEFHIEVYAVPDKNQQVGSKTNTPVTPVQPSQVRKERNPEETPRNDAFNISPPRTNTDATTKSPDQRQDVPTPILLSTDSKAVDSSRKTRQTDSEPGSNPPLPLPPHFHTQGAPERGNNPPPPPPFGSRVPPFIPPNAESTGTTNSTVSTSSQQNKYTRDTKNQDEKNTQPRVSSNNKDQRAPIVPPAVANKPTDVNNDQTRSVRDAQNEEKSDDKTKPVQPVFPANIVPKISVGNAPEIIPPNIYDSNGENKERANSGVPTSNQQSKHTRDTKEQEKDTQPRTLSNKDEKTPIIPPVIANKPVDTNKEQTRKERDVHSQEKAVDSFKSSQAPAIVAKSFENATNFPVINNEKRTSRDVEKEEKSNENSRRPFVPANVAKSIENATNIRVEDKRIARDAQHEDTYEPTPRVNDEPIIPANIAKTIDNATYDTPNNEKRNARDTQDVNKSGINVSTDKTTDNRRPPSFAARNFGRNGEHSTHTDQKSQDPQNQGRNNDNAYTSKVHVTNDGFPKDSQIGDKARVARDTKNSQADENKPKPIDNNGKTLNPPAVTNKNAEPVRPRVPKARGNRPAVPRVPNTQTDKNNPSTPKTIPNAPRTARSVKDDAPGSPPALFGQAKDNDNGKAMQFKFQGTDSRSSIFPTTVKATTTTTATTTKKSKRETDLDESDEKNTSVKKHPKISAQITTSKPVDQKPVISIQ